MKTYLHGPLDYAKTHCDFVQGAWTCQKEERGIPRAVERKKTHRYALVAKQQSRTHIVGESEIYKGETGCVRDEEDTRM